MANTTTVAAPIAWQPSSYWDGNDGLWNTFVVNVGTPPQQFRILPSTAGQETWLPDPQGCQVADPSNPGYCGFLRGTLPVNGTNSSGFSSKLSSSWTLIGAYTLDAQVAELGYTGNGLWGFDTVTLNDTSSTLTQSKQVAASVPDLDFWLGVFGLGPKSINFTSFNDPIPNYMSNLVSSNKIPSLSWGYTAGAHYRGDQGPASLTLGGYDTNRFEATNITFDMDSDNSRPLQVAIQKIIGQDTLAGSAINLLPTPKWFFIDSTLPHIWLPDDAIRQFVRSFGLTYDNNTDLYLINSTMRSKMLQLNPTVTFFLSNATYSGTTYTQNIELPYSAFDMQASYPYYTNATHYFPIRRAANSSQYTFGRTFLQEAYLIADFERYNFTVAQTAYDNVLTKHLVAIEKPVGNNTSGTQTSTRTSKGVSAGAIAGIVIAAIAGIALIAWAIWFVIRRNKRKHQPVPTADPEEPDKSEEYSPDKKDDAHRGSELPSENAFSEAPGNAAKGQTSELATPLIGAEIEGDMGRFRGRAGMHEMPSPPVGHESKLLAEAPGSEAQRYELMGSEPALKNNEETRP
ncbi:hypothetical protein BAUCODRAFT_119360 [Baudoinia panamericana UAMH 10762]|uniref:Peptidase A1 domain-containing protein n=1 Tax=Baudoinia panamericana (strain UAMH 10762) TaxID=717646 RepID=M2MSE0_BAUPA|nr:uncharacterized protein BAUCODRAFT_119360 [Baudoinia panamericana UAMH 10762]EMC99786.1 hypothetical protein BAUCODRAFT_119360 [Baudoinia panamericana UAMH 10762]